MFTRLTFCFTIFFCSLLQAMPPPPIQLATIYHEDIDITEYWVSEKLDGFRAYWDGKQLISRQGNIYKTPSWFTDDFPSVPLDGELWIGRNQFQILASTIRKHYPINSEWKRVSFMIFDLPSSPLIFTERINKMENIIANSSSPYLKMITQQKIQNNQQLQQMLEQVLSGGGEGLMLHKGNALYQAKRSQDLMKLKQYQDDEAVVLQHVLGQGKYTGKLGSLLVKNSEGVVFKIGTGFSDAERDNPPPIGATITYKYIGKTDNNIPRFASYMRIRENF